MKTVRAYKHVCLCLLECCSFCMKHHPHPPPLRVQYAAVSLQQRNGKGRDDAGCSTSGNFESFLREFSLSVPIPVPGISKILRCAKTIHFMETPWKTACEKLHQERMSYRCSWTFLIEPVLRGTSSKVGYRYITLFRHSFFYKNSYLIRILRLKFVKF